ncbi:MATE family efflux transporter [Tissierella creatinophila]|uniref:Multidrug resistance protein MdtK n=1 Tax=Tissierella creatinophila DSM 6911 TaxID=1123403 RepID=A0A1U7M602_TISCR|nr:MATE family efflux transporter [Tissierella creatinophila]OLS02737.1 multidrug resistance protein MdtK [Tissierella creatinophila DSM 6911]
MKFWKDKVFLKAMVAIALPIALQNLITSSLNMVDTLMISSLGDASIAAVGLANQIFFFYSVINFGIHSGSSIFISQYWGKQDVSNIKRVLGISLFLTTIAGVIFTVAGFFFPRLLMNVFTHDEEVVRLGATYLRTVSLSYLITGISFAYSIALRSTGRPKVPMMISGISFITNTVFNYVLIFGKFGFPTLGVKGAALGTLIARIVEIAFLFYIVYRDIGPLSATIKELMDWNKAFIKRYIDTISPVVINEAFWSLGQIMYSIAYARIGKEAIAAVQLTNTIQNIFFVLVRGLANACAVIIGNKIGRGEDRESVYDYALKFLSISLVIGGILGGILAFTPDLTLKIFKNLEPNVYKNARMLLIFMGLTFAIRSYNATAIVGVLRGGGDTKYSMILEIGSVWLVGVPLGFLGSLVFKYPVYIVFLLVTFEEIFKFIISIPRITSKKWIKKLT